MIYTEQGKYSVTKSRDSKKIFNILIDELTILKQFNNLSDIRITDATAGNGGDTITFAKKKLSVLSIEKDRSEYDTLLANIDKHNLNVTTICDSCLNHISDKYQDILYMDPPWGGPGYEQMIDINLKLDNIAIFSITHKILSNKMALIVAIKAPFNFDYMLYKKRLNLYNICSQRYSVGKYYIIVSKKEVE